MQRFTLALSTIALLLMCSACGGQRELTPLKPLQGKTFPTLTTDQVKTLSQADIILIGEIHDHPHHHLIQADMIRKLHPRAVAFEMLNSGQKSDIDQLANTPSSQWDTLLKWSKRGWPDFELYRPVFEATFDVKAQIVAGHPDRKTLTPLMLGKPLPKDLIHKLKLDVPLPPQARISLEEEIKRGHCGHAPSSMIPAMVAAQRLKDAWMAHAVLNAPKPVVFIVGRGHTLLSRGIPWALKELAQTSDQQIQTIKVVSLHIKGEGSSETSDFDHGEADIHLLTEPHRTDDPCERFKKKLEQMKRKHNRSKMNHTK